MLNEIMGGDSEPESKEVVLTFHPDTRISAYYIDPDEDEIIFFAFNETFVSEYTEKNLHVIKYLASNNGF